MQYVHTLSYSQSLGRSMHVKRNNPNLRGDLQTKKSLFREEKKKKHEKDQRHLKQLRPLSADFHKLMICNDTLSFVIWRPFIVQFVLHYQRVSDIPGSQMPPAGSRAKTSS